MDHTLKQALIGIVGRANFTDSLIDLISYSYDASDHDHRPNAALWPTCSEEVSRTLQLADGCGGRKECHHDAELSILKCSNLLNIGEGQVEGGKYKVEFRMWFEEIFNSPQDSQPRSSSASFPFFGTPVSTSQPNIS